MIFRFYHITKGAHVHCRLFSGAHDNALSKCGNLIMRVQDFEQFRETATFIEFRLESEAVLLLDPYRLKSVP